MCDYIVSWKCQNTSQWLLTVLFKNFQNKAGQLFAIDTNSSVFTCGFSLDCTNFHILAHSMVWSKARSCKKPPRHNCLLTFTIIYYFLSKKYFYSIIIECLTSLQFYLRFQYEKKNSEDMNPADDASFVFSIHSRNAELWVWMKTIWSWKSISKS